MGNVIRSPINGRAVALRERSGSHSLALAAAQSWWPESLTSDLLHPAAAAPLENWNGENADTCLVVRNPVERFRSAVAKHSERTLEEHLAKPVYGPLPKGDFVRHFRFEDQLNAAAEWLGLPTPLPQEDATDEADKPTLTPEQEARVRELFADDIALWESLQ